MGSLTETKEIEAGQSVLGSQSLPCLFHYREILDIVGVKYTVYQFAVGLHVTLVLECRQHGIELVDVILLTGISLFYQQFVRT